MIVFNVWKLKEAERSSVSCWGYSVENIVKNKLLYKYTTVFTSNITGKLLNVEANYPKCDGFYRINGKL